MRSRLLSLVAPLLVSSTLLLAGTRAGAQVTTTTVSTVTTTSTSTTTTTAPAPTTTSPPSTIPSASPTRPAPPPPVAGGDEPVDGSFVLPPELQAKVNAVRRTAPNDDAKLLDVVTAYANSAHIPLEQAMVLGLGHFPVAGPAHWVHDWLMPRRGPPIHLHQGTDVWAAMGTPLRAPYDGRLRYEDAGLGGLAAYVTATDGTYYYLAHMAGTAPGLASGATVRQGQVVGFVGDSGNARGGPAHLHFEVHPRGGAAVDPKPLLDRWVKEAIAYAFELATNPSATTAPERAAPAPDPVGGRPVVPRSTAPRRTARAANVDSGGGSAGRIFVIGSFLALCGGRVMRRMRARIATAPDDE
jgi:murein DD-endopeptidase MepM/ murein hydrolase activator NlpD